LNVVVDTSAWIEWLLGSDLGRTIGKTFPSPQNTIVPTIVQLELAKWMHREAGERSFDRLAAYMTTCQVRPLTTRIALLAADQHRAHKLATADAIIYATALENDSEVLTCDAHFKALSRVLYFAKE
jgi:predicted nucleic acid-binding protein